MIIRELELLDNLLQLKLKEARAKYQHSGNKGSVLESNFRNIVLQAIPRLYSVSQGEVVDHNNNRTRQTDIVILNEYHPHFLEEINLFLIEGVSAAGEVKANLTPSHLLKALEASVQFKRLEIDPGNGTTRHSSPSDNRFYRCPPWFIFAYESRMSMETIGRRVNDFASANSLDIEDYLDAIFVLNKGWLINFGDGHGFHQFSSSDGVTQSGWVLKNSKSVAVDLFGWLSSVMPVMHRYQPILPPYLMQSTANTIERD